MEYKFVELLSCNFIASPEDVIRAHICFRYNTLKSRLALVQARLQDIESLIKVCVCLCARVRMARTGRCGNGFSVLLLTSLARVLPSAAARVHLPVVKGAFACSVAYTWPP